MKHFLSAQLCFFILMFSLSHLAFGQLNKEWDNTLGGTSYDGLSAAVAAPDGGYLLGGSSSSNASGDKTADRKGSDEFLRDFWLVKLDAAGNVQWDKTIGSEGNDNLEDLIVTPDGGYLIGGTSAAGASADKSEDSKGGADYWLVKLDASGNIEWDRTFGGSEADYLISLHATSDGGYLLGGTSSSGISGDKTEANAGSFDFWLLKIDASGNKLWDKSYGHSSYDGLSDIASTADGGYLLGGSSSFDAPEGEEAMDIWLLKIDANGNPVWDKIFGGNSSDGLTAIVPATDGGYLLAGGSSSDATGDKSENSRGASDFWAIKIDAMGNKQWDSTFGGSGTEVLYDAAGTADGSFLLAGLSLSEPSGDKTAEKIGSSDYWLVKVDASGNKVWDSTYGGTSAEHLTAVVASSQGDVLLAGYSLSGASAHKSEDNVGHFDYWVLKLSEDRPEPGGFISGAGRYYSPAGAYLPNPAMEGRAIFSFMGRQTEPNTSPIGNAILLIPSARFHFMSESLESVYVENSVAYLRGSGRLNREGGYTFLLSIEDRGEGFRGPKDTFRMIIWNSENEVVYDNEHGAPVDAAASMPIETGVIRIHQERERGMNAYARELPEMLLEEEGAREFNAYPTYLATSGLWIEVPAREKAEVLSIRIFDLQGKEMARRKIKTDRFPVKEQWQLRHADWPTGIYLLRIEGKELHWQQKLLKQ